MILDGDRVVPYIGHYLRHHYTGRAASTETLSDIAYVVTSMLKKAYASSTDTEEREMLRPFVEARCEAYMDGSTLRFRFIAPDVAPAAATSAPAPTAHTPGPWKAERHGIVTAFVAGHRRQVAAMTGEAVMHSDVPNVIEGQMANARLAAAAPALLDAVTAALKYIPGSEVRSWPPGHRLRKEALEKLEAALKQVRGDA